MLVLRRRKGVLDSFTRKNILVVLFFSLCFITWGHAQWLTDYPAAREQAKKEKKLVLLNFDGSDWCKYSRLIDQEVFHSQNFKSFAMNYVLVMIDFPQHKALPSKLNAQNDELENRFNIYCYPTLIVIDPFTGKELHRAVGYNPGAGSISVISQLK